MHWALPRPCVRLLVVLIPMLTASCVWRGPAARSAASIPLAVTPRSAPIARAPHAEALSFAAWTLGGAASVALDGKRGLTLAYCCTKESKASFRWTPSINFGGPPSAPTAGRVRLRVDVDPRAGCSRATRVELVGSAGQRWVLPLESVAAVTRRCPLRVDRGLEIAITAVGGLRCCGKTRLSALAVEPVSSDASGWSRRRCGWLRKGLLAASRVGHDEVLAFVSDLPP